MGEINGWKEGWIKQVLIKYYILVLLNQNAQIIFMINLLIYQATHGPKYATY